MRRNGDEVRWADAVFTAPRDLGLGSAQAVAESAGTEPRAYCYNLRTQGGLLPRSQDEFPAKFYLWYISVKIYNGGRVYT